jgi:hypothetical protein
MAVFGVPQVHEDDALRACRAAVEMRDALPELGVQARIGVNTGEVVTGTEERLATGDAVNVAARLEQAAQAGEILIGEETLALVRDVVQTESVPPLELKGKTQTVPAFRLLAVTGELSRRHDVPMVGRDRELTRLRSAYEQAAYDRSCQLFTVLGAAGVGKSRLVSEFLNGLDTRVVRGRCLSYGEGITYWPVVEILTQLGERPEQESAAAAIRSVMGETAETTSPDEIAWAFRKTLEQVAGTGPFVCVFDDIHWAEPALLDLIEHMADWSRDAPILLLCMARPEFLDRRAGWAGGKLNATTVLLEALSSEETDELIERLAPVDGALRVRIREAAEGNPFFVEEMLAMVREAGNGDVTVPPTIQALLAARLDQLEAPERALLERGAVEGKTFHRGAVQALGPDEREVPRRLMGLVRKELVRPDKPLLAGEDAFRFRHLLVRDAAYEALSKATRADLHERFAAWLAEHGRDLVELDEILGYHLEHAVRYRQELGQPVDAALRAAARARLVAAGRKARLRGDLVAAANLLERAAPLLPEGEVDPELELDLIDAYFHLDFTAAAVRARSFAEQAEAIGDARAAVCARVMEAQIGSMRGAEGTTPELERLSNELLQAAGAVEDHFGLYVAYWGLTNVNHMNALFDRELEAVERAVDAARVLGRIDLEARMLAYGGASRLFGATPVDEILAWLDEQDARGLRHASLASHRAYALAMAGRFDEARVLAADNRQALAERGAKVLVALMTAHNATDIELFAGDAAAAARFAEEGCRLLEEVGDRGWLCTACAKLGQAYERLGRLDEAEAQAARSAELGTPEDIANEQQWREVRAKVLARRGEAAEAERIAREAVALGERSSSFGHYFGVFTLAEVLELNGDAEEAATTFESAREGFERKGFVPMAASARERREALLLQFEQ